jgi:phosphoglycolate phosphatase
MSSSSPERGPLALDLDGTLLDAEPRQVELMASLVDPDLAPVVRAELWARKREGASSETALRQLGVAPAVAADLARHWTEAVEDDRWLALDRPLPGVTETLRELNASGRGPIVVTARRYADRVRIQLENVGMAELLAGVEVVSPAAVAAEKELVLRRIGACAYVGDTERDAEAAAAAGVPFAAVATGQRSARFLRARGFEPQDRLQAAVAALGVRG